MLTADGAILDCLLFVCQRIDIDLAQVCQLCIQYRIEYKQRLYALYLYMIHNCLQRYLVDRLTYYTLHFAPYQKDIGF